jgi:hypothetical protein
MSSKPRAKPAPAQAGDGAPNAIHRVWEPMPVLGQSGEVYHTSIVSNKTTFSPFPYS